MTPNEAAQLRLPIRIKVEGGIGGLLTPGTAWTVTGISSHYEPGGIIGEDPPQYTLIDFDPLTAERSAGAAPLDANVLADALYLTRFDMGGKPVMREDMDRLMAEYARLASEGTDR